MRLSRKVSTAPRRVATLRSLLDQDRVAAREHLNEADELSYQIQQELSSLRRG